MKSGSAFNVKEYFWTSLKRFTNTFSSLKVTNLGNGYVKCFWQISSTDNIRIKFSKSFFYAIRLFDVTNNRNKNNSTCIMKEIQVNKFQSSTSFPIPINKGVYYFEFGYRKNNGDWRKLACQKLNFGYSIKKEMQSFDYDDWFNPTQCRENSHKTIHEEAYQLSLNTQTGGSEKIIYDTKFVK